MKRESKGQEERDREGAERHIDREAEVEIETGRETERKIER